MKPSQIVLSGTVLAVGLAAILWFSGFLNPKVPAFDVADFRSPTGQVEKSEQRPGDAETGRMALLNAPYVSCGIPYSAYSRLNPDVLSPARLSGREGRNAELPYALTSHVNADGVEIISNNCLTCHAAQIEGELIIGLGNEFADFTRDPSRTTLQTGNYVRGEAETRAWAQWADRIDAISPYIQMKTVGPNPATNLTWALMSHLDPEELTWSQESLLAPPPRDPLPISVPPWWGLSKKNAMFYTTIGRGDHARFMLLASMLCIDGTNDVDEIVSYAADIRAFIASLEPPAYPFPVDTALAEQGEVIFQRACAECHGTYGETPSFPNTVYPIASVGTDPAYATEATNGDRDRFYEWVARSPYGGVGSAAPAPGYIAPPLDGVWATAPYLHNGSVPSMEALLQSDLRPEYWRHQHENRQYDQQAMGWRFEALPSGQDAESDADIRRYIYDTTLRGYGNEGHTYSDEMSEDDRKALLEYLKTL